METTMKDIIIRLRNGGYERDDGSARYIYDACGKYLGQFQADCLSDEICSGEIWLPTYDGDRCYHELTSSQMAAVEG